MAYFLDLFSPETYEAFTRSPRNISGFRSRQRGMAGRVQPGDKLVCYLTKLSRWIGILDVVSGAFEDDSPIFYPESDPFTVRFAVRAEIWLPVEKGVPIHEDRIWDTLTFTKGQYKGTSTWTGKIRTSLGRLEESDGAHIERALREQAAGGADYAVNNDEWKKLSTHRIRRADKDVTVTVPVDSEPDPLVHPIPQSEARESIRVQALLAEIGSRMGMQIWLPRNDKANVEAEWRGDHPAVLDRLPLNYDDTTLRTIEQIDVLWLKGRAIKRAFEVEHTTSIYSGILRMADLLALQPNMDIRLHIVAPIGRRDKVFQELRRPVFSLLDRGPLSESCTYLSYDSVRELSDQPHLAHLADSVLDEYEEDAEG
ncbi:MAG: hypothetical protein H0W30_09820 [Gemmatimonadaceae bacterium]|nr:hypothetical protein [Gemmatimonadaceae bacterium]